MIDIININSNTCVILNLAIEDSTVPITIARTNIIAKKASKVSHPPREAGIIRFAIKASKINILIAEAHVISPKSFPELSKIITS